MKILVTGGAGFIGGNFVHYMVNKYPEDMIVNLDLLTYAGNLETLKPVEDKPNYKFIRGDIADRPFIMELFEKEKFDVVVNFAAESHVDRSITDPGIFVRTNVMGTQTLLDAAKEYGVKRYHQVSTDEVYGDLPLDRPDLFFTEETPIHTSSPYSASKASADLFVLAYHRTFGLPVTVSRCSNNYGPYHFPEKLIPLMISRALADESLPVYGKGENVRDWLHVSDHCAAIDLIIRKGRVGEIYNIGGHNYFKLRDIAALVDFGVEWDQTSSTIQIDTTHGYQGEGSETAPVPEQATVRYVPTVGDRITCQDGYIYEITDVTKFNNSMFAAEVSPPLNLSRTL